MSLTVDLLAIAHAAGAAFRRSLGLSRGQLEKRILHSMSELHFSWVLPTWAPRKAVAMSIAGNCCFDMLKFHSRMVQGWPRDCA